MKWKGKLTFVTCAYAQLYANVDESHTSANVMYDSLSNKSACKMCAVICLVAGGEMADLSPGPLF